MSSGVEHFGLEGRRALVIGADTPAGGAIARAYAEAGARVCLCGPDAAPARERLQAVRSEVQGEGGQVALTTADPAIEAEVEAAVERAAAELGGLDVVASCPDLFLARPIAETSGDALERVLAVNFKGPFAAARAAAALLAQSPEGGRIVLVSHVLGERGLPNTAAYGAACAATQSLVRSLAQELAPQGVTINCIALGWMEWMEDRLDPRDEEAARAVRFTVAKRAGRADEVGPMAVWLSGSGSGFVTGQSFAVDGGLLQHL